MVMVMGALSGCVPLVPPYDPSAAVLSAGAFDFNWRLSGERAVAPLQVFNNQHQVWLQFRPGQHLPAIFAYQDGRYHAVQYQYFEPYVVIEGTWRNLLFQGGQLQAQAQYGSTIANRNHFAEESKPTNPPPNKQLQQRAPHPPETPTAAHEHSSQTELAQALRTAAQEAMSSPQHHKAADRSPKEHDKTETTPKRRTERFIIEPADHTLRQALQRWAKQAGWFFADEHWGLQVDYPIVNKAEFEGSFEQSIEQLLQSVQLSAQPLRACFYRNRVLRVIPESQFCWLGGESGRFNQ